MGEAHAFEYQTAVPGRFGNAGIERLGPHGFCRGLHRRLVRSEWRIVDNLLRVLVLAQPQEGSVPENGIGSPAGEFDLGDEPRFDPMHALARRPLWQTDGRLGPCEGVEPLSHIGAVRGAESRSGLSAIATSPDAVVG